MRTCMCGQGAAPRKASPGAAPSSARPSAAENAAGSSCPVASERARFEGGSSAMF